MPRMSEEVAQAVNGLSRDEKFQRLLAYFKAMEKELQEQINMTSTPKDEREVLVHVRENLKKEVIEVVELAHEVLERKDKLTRQA